MPDEEFMSGSNPVEHVLRGGKYKTGVWFRVSCLTFTTDDLLVESDFS